MKLAEETCRFREIPHMKNMLRKIKNKGNSIRFIHIFMMISMLLLCALLLYSNIRLQSECTALKKNMDAGQQIIESGLAIAAHQIKIQRIWIIGIVLVLCVNEALFYRKITSVTERHVRCAASGESADGGDACELRYPAENYNDKNGKHKNTENRLLGQTDPDGANTIGNRGEFEKSIRTRLAGEEKGRLLLIDVDKLKEINDSYNHDMGDTVLRNVALTVRLCFRNCDDISRLESDEFAVWMRDLSQDSVDCIRQRIASVNDRLLHPEYSIPPVSISAGAAFSETGDDFKSLYKKANGALYRVKVGGRCGFEVYT